MSEKEHQEIEKKLEDKYLNKMVKVLNENDSFIVLDIYVDYRKECQDMNRFADDNGNIYYIGDIIEVLERVDK